MYCEKNKGISANVMQSIKKWSKIRVLCKPSELVVRNINETRFEMTVNFAHVFHYHRFISVIKFCVSCNLRFATARIVFLKEFCCSVKGDVVCC